MPFNLFKPTAEPEDGYGISEVSDRDFTSVGSIRTTPLVKGFVKLSEAQLKAEQDRLKQRKEFQKRFEKLLELRKEWDGLDTAATVALYKHLAEIYGNLIQKRMAATAVKVVQEQSRLATAKADIQLDQTRNKIDLQIEQLRTQRDNDAKKLTGDKT